MPPNSASNLKIEVSEDNLLADSRVSGIDESDAPTGSQTNLLPSDQQLIPHKVHTDEQALDLQLPLSGAKVLKHYLKRPGLTEYEKSEILDYR